MSPADKVRYERAGDAAVLTINRPERRNAIDDEAAEMLLDGLRRFEADPGARALVVTGGAEAFSAGADLEALAARGEALASAPDPERALGDWLAERPEGPLGFTRLEASKPTIAAISGWCLAGGLELALWCDLRIATASARLGFAERRFGVPLIDGGTQRLPRIVGRARALELILTGRLIEGREAAEWGLVNEVVPAGRHLERALELAALIASFPAEATLSDRRAVLEGADLPLAEGLALEADLGAASIRSGLAGARRFAAGEGRGGRGLGG